MRDDSPIFAEMEKRTWPAGTLLYPQHPMMRGTLSFIFHGQALDAVVHITPQNPTRRLGQSPASPHDRHFPNQRLYEALILPHAHIGGVADIGDLAAIRQPPL